MAGIYSERFLMCEGNAVMQSTVVPARRRWVLRNLLMSRAADTGGVNLRVGVRWAIVFNFTPAAPVVALDMRVVAYAGEAVQLVTYGSATWATLSGYQFDDLNAAPGPPAPAHESAPPLVTGLPAWASIPDGPRAQ
jgi:hypothetical protein